jgi:Bacterial cadherin-like domain
MRFPWPRETVMAILSINNAIDGLSEGGTVNVSAASGVLATDTDPFGAALAVSAVGFNTQTTNVSAVIAGSYGTLTMHADGSNRARQLRLK